jgi:3-phenylpropionate/trans-cinnamate dioxygenase ferredoxin component
MPEFVTVASAAEFNSGDRIVVEVNNHLIAVFKVGDSFYAIEDICTHDDGPLAEGDLHGTEIECPRHGARFDITTGRVLSFPAITDVPWYAVQVIGDAVQVKV